MSLDIDLHIVPVVRDAQRRSGERNVGLALNRKDWKEIFGGDPFGRPIPSITHIVTRYGDHEVVVRPWVKPGQVVLLNRVAALP